MARAQVELRCAAGVSSDEERELVRLITECGVKIGTKNPLAIFIPVDDRRPRLSEVTLDRRGRLSSTGIPLIIIKRNIDEQTVRDAVAAGALTAISYARLPLLIESFLSGPSDRATSPAFDLVPTGIVTLDVFGRFIRANDRYCEMHGYDRDELGGRPFSLTTDARDIDETRLRIALLISGLVETTQAEKRNTRKDGSLMWLRVSSCVAYKPSGAIDFFITAAEDVSAQRVAEEKIRFQARLLDCAEQAIVATDVDAHIVYWNVYAEKLFGWRAEEVIGQNPINNFAAPLGLERHTEIRKLIESGEGWSGEVELSTRDARTFHASVTCSPIFDSSGAFIGIVSISNDATAQRQSDEALRRRFSQLLATTDLGRLALRGTQLDELFGFAASCVAGILDAEFVEITKRQNGSMLVINGFGFNASEFGSISYANGSSYAATVLSSDEPVVIENCNVFEKKSFASSVATRIATELTNDWGILAVHTARRRSFDLEDRLFLSSIANVLGDAIHRRAMEVQLSVHAEQQSAIADLSRFALVANSDQEIIDEACRVTGEVLQVEHPLFFRYDAERNAMIIVGGRVWTPDAFKVAIPANSESVAGHVFVTGEPVAIDDYSKEVRFGAAKYFTPYGIVSGVAAPVKGLRGTIGAIVAHSRKARRFTSADVKFMQAFGNVVAQAMEHNASRRELAESEARHRSVVEGAAEIIFSVNCDGMIATLNAAFEPITGWKRSEWIGRPFRDLVLAPDRDLTDRAFERLMQGGSVTRAEIHLRGRDRGILVDANAFVRGDANSRKIYGFARDITAANAAEEDRKRLLSELQLLLDSTDEGIFAVDTEGRCTMLNHSAAATLGFKSEELFGEQVHGLFHQRRIDGSMYPEETCPITAVMRDGNPRRITDEVFWNASGQPIAVDYSAAPIVADGLIRGVVVTFTDVTERRKLEAQLERAERLGSLGRLAATVAHEFNNVLMSISPFVEILRRDATTPRSSGACDQILKALRRGKGITEEILRFTQPAEPRLASIPASDWINAFATEAASLLGNRIEFKIVSDADVPNILGDANQLHQVFTNLVINARDAMPGGGVLEIGVRRELKAKVFPFGVVRNAEQFAHFWIRDTGTGMPPEVLRHIFEPLFTTKRNGTGLGLAVTHQVVKRHGGELFVQSKVGVGSTFHLFIPLAGFATTTVAPPATESKPKRARFQRILIVEDEPAVADGIAAVLRLEGTSVEVVGTGAAAIVSVRASRPDAVILDVGLPDIDGHKVYERLMTIDSNLPVVFSTGHEVSEADGHEQRPTTAWLMKPYELDVLLEALDRLASNATASDAKP